MLHVNFNTYNNYVTDSLYQWDKDQDLIINGLGLSVAPEVHFANANMDKAIVKQSNLSSNVITVRIPNSVLQEALTIKAYVGVYEDTTFKVIEIIEIPVIAKAKPADYTLEVSDEEVYSFNALDNRISNIIANANSPEGNSELVDIRLDYKGNIHATAGDAVRAQFEEFSENKVDKSSVVQTTGNATDKVMNQKAVTDVTDNLRNNSYRPRGIYYFEDGTDDKISNHTEVGYCNLSDFHFAKDAPKGVFGSAMLRNEVLGDNLIAQTMYVLRNNTYYRTIKNGVVGEWFIHYDINSFLTSKYQDIFNIFGGFIKGVFDVARGITWGITGEEISSLSNPLNNYVSFRSKFLNYCKIKLDENVLVKVIYVDKNGNYISDTGWVSKTENQFAKTVAEYIEIKNQYIYLALASTTLNDNDNYDSVEKKRYTETIIDHLSKIHFTITLGAEKEETSDLQGKKWLFIGDSITEHNFRATKNYDEYLADWFGIVPINVGMSGTGVTYPFQGNPSWLDKLPEYPEDVDVISVMGALNDRHTELGAWGDRGTDTVYGAVWNYFNNLINKYPNKSIVYITSTPREYSYGVDGEFTAWVDAFIKTAHNFSIPVLDLYRNSGLRPWNATNNKEYFSCSDAPNGDGVHPNAKGQKLMALKIAEFAKQYLTQ